MMRACKDRPVAEEELVTPRDRCTTFQWTVKINGMEKATNIVPMRMDNARNRGVRLPDFWRTSLRCRHLQQLADQAASDIDRVVGRLPEYSQAGRVVRADCQMVGVPKRHDGLSLDLRPGDAIDVRPGAVVPFEEDTGRVDYILCAHISGSKWYCHSGNFSGSAGSLPRGEIEGGDLDVSGLVVKDLAADAWVSKTPKKKQSAGRRLQKLVHDSRDSWDHLVAVSAFLAEGRAAQEKGRAIDFGIAVASFEPDPWQWKVPEGRMSQTGVSFLWRWKDKEGRWCNELVSILLNNLLRASEVPWPKCLRYRRYENSPSRVARFSERLRTKAREAEARIDRLLQAQRSGSRVSKSKRSKDLCAPKPRSP